jgi:hypothetical protein
MEIFMRIRNMTEYKLADLAQLMMAAGWRDTYDAQWTGLEKIAPQLWELLDGSSPPEPAAQHCCGCVLELPLNRGGRHATTYGETPCLAPTKDAPLFMAKYTHKEVRAFDTNGDSASCEQPESGRASK